MKIALNLAIALLALTMAVSGCTPDAPDSSAVQQRTWVLQSLAGASVPEPAEGAATAELTLENGKVNGNGGVNILTGTYVLDGDALSFGSLASTKMAGPPEAMDQETQFLSALAAAAKVAVDGDTLRILQEDGTELMVMVAR